MDFIVVGAGIAGSCVARVARDRGHHVEVVSAGPPASLAALAVMRMGWHKGPDLHLAARSLALYRAWDVPLHAGATVSSYRGHPERFDRDYWVMDPVQPLVPATVGVRAIAIEAGRVTLDGNGHGLSADAVVDCRGAAVCEGKLWGATAVSRQRDRLVGTAARVHALRPYYAGIAALVAGDLRVGSSLAPSRELAVGRLYDMLDAMRDAGLLAVGSEASWGVEVGVRGSHAKGLRKWEAAPGLGRLTGLHRTGYALAPAMAETLVTRLETYL